MTNQIAIVLGAILVAAVCLDAILNGGDTIVFLARKLFELIEWIAFWR